jgi:hypothetical protein
MAGPLYFFPGVAKAGRAQFEAAGLGHALDGAGVGACGTTERGPDGGKGAIVAPPCPRGRAPIPQLADVATWAQVPGREVWIGWLTDDRPTPADLARRVQVPGYEVELADGARWTVPVARRVAGAPGLPRALRWDGSAWAPGDVVPKHAQLWAVACRVWDALIGAAGAEVTLTLECDAAALALACNYRVGPPEISALGLFTTATQSEVIKALVDFPALEELAGKAEAAGRSSSPGGED